MEAGCGGWVGWGFWASGSDGASSVWRGLFERSDSSVAGLAAASLPPAPNAALAGACQGSAKAAFKAEAPIGSHVADEYTASDLFLPQIS